MLVRTKLRIFCVLCCGFLLRMYMFVTHLKLMECKIDLNHVKKDRNVIVISWKWHYAVLHILLTRSLCIVYLVRTNIYQKLCCNRWTSRQNRFIWKNPISRRLKLRLLEVHPNSLGKRNGMIEIKKLVWVGCKFSNLEAFYANDRKARMKLNHISGEIILT